MNSQIDPTKPGEGAAYTADMRANFRHAADEISNLQTRVGNLEMGGDTELELRVNELELVVADLQADVTRLKAQHMEANSVQTPNPPNTNSTVFVSAGIGVQFTPQHEGSTRAVVLVSGQLGNTQNGNPSELQLMYGEGASPSAGTPVSNTNGQFVGGVVSMLAAKSNDFTPFSAEALLTGLVPDTLYWFGVAYRAVAGTATLSQMSLVAFSLQDSI